MTREAVSYVWADPKLSHTVPLMDESTLSVTTSLAKALPYLTSASRTGYLWVDQITIDQFNTMERSEQVKIMGDIYSRCVRCLIWYDPDPFLDAKYEIEADWSLGMGEDVMEFFQSFSNENPVNEWQSGTGANLRRVSTTSTSGSSRTHAARRDSHVKDHLLWVFEHPWFKRVRVFQEFVLAPHSSFLIGDFELPGDGTSGSLNLDGYGPEPGSISSILAWA